MLISAAMVHGIMAGYGQISQQPTDHILPRDSLEARFTAHEWDLQSSPQFVRHGERRCSEDQRPQTLHTSAPISANAQGCQCKKKLTL